MPLGVRVCWKVCLLLLLNSLPCKRELTQHCFFSFWFSPMFVFVFQVTPDGCQGHPELLTFSRSTLDHLSSFSASKRWAHCFFIPLLEAQQKAQSLPSVDVGQRNNEENILEWKYLITCQFSCVFLVQVTGSGFLNSIHLDGSTSFFACDNKLTYADNIDHCSDRTSLCSSMLIRNGCLFFDGQWDVHRRIFHILMRDFQNQWQLETIIHHFQGRARIGCVVCRLLNSFLLLIFSSWG